MTESIPEPRAELRPEPRPGPRKDELTPAGKDPAEGPRGPSQGAPAVVDPEESHLGAAGDPAEGPRED